MSRRPVTVYLEDADREKLAREAASLGMSLSAYLRLKVRSQTGVTSSTGNVTFRWGGNESVEGRDVK